MVQKNRKYFIAVVILFILITTATLFISISSYSKQQYSALYLFIKKNAIKKYHQKLFNIAAKDFELLHYCVQTDDEVNSYILECHKILKKKREQYLCIRKTSPWHVADYETSDGEFIVYNENYKQGWINNNGETIVPFQFDDIIGNVIEEEGYTAILNDKYG